MREATPDDAHVLAELRFEFRASVNDAAEARSDFVARTKRWMAQRLGRGFPWRCWVAEREGLIVGHLWLQFVEKIPNPAVELEVHAYITNVYTRPEVRGNGLGERLLEAALEACREERVDSVILWPTERSRSLYERHGFAVRNDLMEAILDPGRALP